MNRHNIRQCRRSGYATVALASAIFATSCSWLSSPRPETGGATTGNAMPEVTPILVTLVAEEGEALAEGQERVLARLRSAMSPDTLAAVRTYETLPMVALPATPEIIALLLTLPDVRSIEADTTVVHQ